MNTIKGVIYFSEIRNAFSDDYISVRKKEARLITDAELLKLPETDESNKNNHEWQLRKKSCQRILDYLKNRIENYSVLDIGCGNGWFANQMALHHSAHVDGLDINTVELEQAARVFNKNNLQFMYADIFDDSINFKKKYDIITLNASIQYFENFVKLIEVLKKFLKPNGEIHVLDSPFYKDSEIESAKKRTKDYYKGLGAEEMSTHYFHHSVKEIKNMETLYKPRNSIFKKIFGIKSNPFYWVKLLNDKCI